MIEFQHGDILKADVEALVNTVNCVGIMGRGIALQFKKAFPANFKAYEAACRRREVEPGRMFVYETNQLTNPRFIINFPTKRHWRGQSRLEDIEIGLRSLASEIRARGIRSVAVPPLGTGLGGLRWSDVSTRIVRELEGLEGVRVVAYEPSAAPTTPVHAKGARAPKMTPGRAALLGLMHRYLAGLMDPFVTLLEVHKLMYFMQEAGEPLRLRYVAGPYGPYAENLRHVLKAIDGFYVSGYAYTGDSPEKPLQLVPGAIQDAAASLERHRETRRRFERVADLVEGFETPFGMELLSTVHWILSRETVATDEELAAKTYAWGERKRQFARTQIRLAREVLASKGWV